MGDPYLLTDRLVLRRFTPDDHGLLVELDSDPAVTFHITGGIPQYDRETMTAWLADYRRWPGYGFFAAEVRETGEFIGWFHLRPEGGADDEPELGYRLRRPAWGNGYATEGARALVDHAFRELGAARVNALSLAVHAASRRVMEKAGLRFIRQFREEWPYRIPGDEHGDVEYAITRAEWEADRRPTV